MNAHQISCQFAEEKLNVKMAGLDLYISYFPDLMLGSYDMKQVPVQLIG